MEFAELILAPKVDGVVMHVPFQKPVEATLCITGHHLILSARKENVEEQWLLHENIDVIERKLSGLNGGSVLIKCKDFRVIRLDINTVDDFNNVATSLERLSSLENPTLKYPFFYRTLHPIVEDGWTAFKPEVEFSKLLLRDHWRISYVNKDFAECPSYPRAVIVPKSISDDVLIASARFRDGGRFPVLSYCHDGGNVLLRSSQPLTGPNNRRCKDDEKLINCVLGSRKKGYIVDTRSQAAAQTAKSRGGGFELEMHYPQWKRVHHPIPRHTALMDSLAKLIDACTDINSSTDKWLSRLDNSGWLGYVKDALYTACLVAQFLDKEGASVLVHGAEGLDSTLLITSLSQIILNPDCRTVRGFEAVIEREWLQGGHPFAKRHSKSAYAGWFGVPTTASRIGGAMGNMVSAVGVPQSTAAPYFLLFLDSIYQLMTQFPCSFEFSQDLLILLFQHSYSSQFGTFLGNNEKERLQLGLSKKTSSLWSYLNTLEVLEQILNPLYEPNSQVIWPSVAPVSLELWSALYLRWIVDQQYQREAWDTMRTLKENDKQLRLEAVKLRKYLEFGKDRTSLSEDVGPED